MSRRDDNPWRRSKPLAVAHRGQRATFPEQTLEAYMEAIRLGADGIETDVQRTRDGRLAMLHDLTVDRTTNGYGPIAGLDWADVRALDAGSWRGERFNGAKIPSLEETIELVVGAGLLLCVEIKGTPEAAPRTPSRSPGSSATGASSTRYSSRRSTMALSPRRGTRSAVPSSRLSGCPKPARPTLTSRSHRRPHSMLPSCSIAGKI